MTTLEEYYNQFNEDKRLNSRHGQVEFVTSMRYIHRCLEEMRGDRTPECLQILDVGAATGRYAIPLSEEGYQVTAVEPVKHNLSRLKQKGPKVLAYQGNALHLKRCPDDTYDLVLLFGPMYHLISREEKEKALSEALRVVKPTGRVLVAYIMNEYGVLTRGFKEKQIRESLEKGLLDESFHIKVTEDGLYSMVRLEDIDALNRACGAVREKIISADGPANYMRRELNALEPEEFELFIRYHLTTCERPELLGAAAHLVDIIHK